MTCRFGDDYAADGFRQQMAQLAALLLTDLLLRGGNRRDPGLSVFTACGDVGADGRKGKIKGREYGQFQKCEGLRLAAADEAHFEAPAVPGAHGLSLI
ncbi:MAG: hypothetical protein AB2L14_37020 [Candidatus Xenobiia bacterium LiM19]